MAWILRILLYIAAPITALFVARDTLNFDIIQMMVVIVLIVVFLAVVAIWPRRMKS